MSKRRRQRRKQSRRLDLEDYFGGTRSSLEAHGGDVGRGVGGYNGWADAELPGDVEEYLPSPDVPIPTTENPIMMPSFLGDFWEEHKDDWKDAWTFDKVPKDKVTQRLGYKGENYNPNYKDSWWEEQKPSYPRSKSADAVAAERKARAQYRRASENEAEQRARYRSYGEVPPGYKEVRFLAKDEGGGGKSQKGMRATSALVKHMQDVYEEFGIPNAPQSPAQLRREKRAQEEQAKKIARKEREIRKKQKEQEEFDSHVETATWDDLPEDMRMGWENLWEDAVPELYEKEKVFDPWKQFKLRDQSSLEAHGADVGRGIGGSNNAKLQELAKQKKLLAEIEQNTRVEEGAYV